MSEKPYYELPAPRETLDAISKQFGHPDNAIEDATGTIKAPELESAETREFLDAAQILLDRPPTAVWSAGEAQGGQGE